MSKQTERYYASCVHRGILSSGTQRFRRLLKKEDRDSKHFNHAESTIRKSKNYAKLFKKEAMID